jgi:butyryl-CoA dehydrogenase
MTLALGVLNLLGRRVVARGGAALAAVGAEIATTCARARAAGVDPAWIAEVERAVGVVGGLTAELGARGLRDPDAMLLHATDYLELFSTVVVAWLWLELAAAAREARGGRDAGFYAAKLAAAQYWIRTELPRIDHLARLCRDGEDSYARLDPDWL